MKLTLTRFREAWRWTEKEEELYRKMLKGYYPILHLFSGRSRLGDIRIDKENFPEVTYRLEIKPSKHFKLPFKDKEFDACIFDPPWINQYFIWASREIPRVTKRRIIAITGCFWWEPAKPYAYVWELYKIYVLKGISPVIKIVMIWDNKNKYFK